MLCEKEMGMIVYISIALRVASKEAAVLLHAPGADPYFEELVRNADVRELTIRRRVSRLNYSRICAEASVVKSHLECGMSLARGMEIGYVVRDAGKWMVNIDRDASEFDASYYRKLLEKAWEELHLYLGIPLRTPPRVGSGPLPSRRRNMGKERHYMLGEDPVRLLIAVFLMLMLSSAALAAHEVHQLGPYTVSFNMITDMNYQIQTQDPEVYPFATLYPLVIKTDNATSASIIITQCKNLTPSVLWMNEEMAALQMALKGINVTTREEMVIDNRNGFLISGMPSANKGYEPSGFMFYQAQYWLDSKDCECGPVSVGTILVNIASTYPQKVTENLLSSLHVASDQMLPTQAQDQEVLITPSLNDIPQETFGFVEGRVYDTKNGVGVASAEMSIDSKPTGIMTDASGNYRLKVPPAQHFIGAQSSGYGVLPSSVMVYRNQTTKLDLKAVGRISLRS